MNLPTVTDLSPYYLVNFKCYLTPIPEISVRACVEDANDIVHSPNSRAWYNILTSYLSLIISDSSFSFISVGYNKSLKLILSFIITLSWSLISILKFERGITNTLAVKTGLLTLAEISVRRYYIYLFNTFSPSIPICTVKK